MKKMNQQLLAAAALAFCSLQVLAQDKPADPPASPISYNLGVVTEYRYRGLAQSSFKPALQGGVDYASPSGFYLGTWISTIDWIKDDGKKHTPAGVTTVTDTGSTNLEIDLYGGYKGALSNGGSYDVGVLQYYYPGNKYSALGASSANANTFEIYGAITAGPVTVKYSRSLSNLFGLANSKGSGYLDVSATFDLGNGFSLVPHVGRQNISGAANGIYSYTDWSITVNKDLGNGLVASLMAVQTTNQSNWISSDEHSNKSKGKGAAVAGLKYTF